MTDDLVVILTALNLEYDAVRMWLTDAKIHRHSRGTLFETGVIGDTGCRVALGLVGKGNASAAVLAERAIQEFSPVAVLFAGVAGALWDATPLGDVVVATQVYAYHGGTSADDGLKARPRSWEVPHWVGQIAAHVARSGDWSGHRHTGDRAPKVHFGPIAAGEIVQNSRISYEAEWIRDHYNDALAIEMEGAGVAQAGHLSGAPVAVIRGISDRADGTKSTSGDGAWQPRAAANAAAFAIRLAEELITERKHTATRDGDIVNEPGTVNTPNTTDALGTVNNHSSGQVGIQAGQVTGSTVYIGAVPRPAAPTDLATELVLVREILAHERSAGRIDEPTYEAARAELDTAADALAADTPEGRNRFVLALKRLRGLIADLTDLATRVANLLVTVKDLR